MGWAFTLQAELGEMLFIADSKYSIMSTQALQRCSANTRLVHTVRRIWRRLTATRRARAAHGKGHNGDPWHECVDVLAPAAHRGRLFPLYEYRIAPRHLGLPQLDPQEEIEEVLPVLLPTLQIGDQRKRMVRRPRTSSMHLLCSFNSLTLSPADERKGGDLFVPARQAQLARSFC